MLPVFFLLISPLWCGFSFSEASQTVVRGFSEASQRLRITAASLLFAREILER